MISFSINSQQVTSGLYEITEALIDLQYKVFDLNPLADRVIEIVREDNTTARLQGVGWDGETFAQLSPETWRRHPNRGTGPPLAGHGTSSRIISDFRIEKQDVGPGVMNVVGFWPNLPFLWVHVTGRPNMPSRDPVGIRQVAQFLMADMLDTFLPSYLFHHR